MYLKKNLLISLGILILVLHVSVFNSAVGESITTGLNVMAEAEDVLAIPGNNLPIYLVVSITNLFGQPITKLNISNFEISTLIAAPGGSSLIDTIRVIETKTEGTYLVYIIPNQQETWKKGVYIFTISVIKDKIKGQSLVNVFVD
jgi:hypothetical protein